jgi:polyisoprenyl-teichoic acid--peptidoglycan teichoic acid transferase
VVKLVTATENQEQPEKTPAPQPATKRSRRWWKVPLLLFFALAFLSSGWFTFKVASATDKIFTEHVGGEAVLKQRLKGGDRVNILLIGIGGKNHDGGDLADTIQLVSVEPSAKRAVMISIPRDLYVQVPDSTQQVKINEVHSIGEEQGLPGGGPALLKKKVGEILGLDVNYFIRADFDGFRQVVDSMGGVEINVKEPLYDPYYPLGHGYQVLNVQAGDQHMNGDLALKYARSRETTSDFDRSRRQQEVLVAARNKALSVSYLTNPTKISQLIDIVGNHVLTDLSLKEAQRLAEIVRDIKPDHVTNQVIDGQKTGLLYDSVGPGGAYILLPTAGNYSEIQEFVKQLLGSSAARSEAARIEIMNASGSEGLAAGEQEQLKAFGVNVIKVGNATESAQQTIIYDYSDGQKPDTIRFLKKRYGDAQVITQPRPKGSTVDIRVVVGTDFQQIPAAGQGTF